MSSRWDVETRQHDFEDVGADQVAIEYGGSLGFYTAGVLTVAYAPGTWLTVSLGESDEVHDV